MISHEKNFIFIHIPKTGGTSIEYGLQPYGKVLQGRENFGSIYFKHVTARSLQTMLGPSEYDRYFKFTFVRNPWDWIVSCYAFCRGLTLPYVAGTPYDISGRVKEEHWDWPFTEWLEWWVETFSPSQSMMVLDSAGQLTVDFIGRFEHLESDFAKVCSTLGLPAAPLPHLKLSERDPYPEYYDTKSMRFVTEHFREDFELGGYPLELEPP